MQSLDGAIYLNTGHIIAPRLYYISSLTYVFQIHQMREISLLSSTAAELSPVADYRVWRGIKAWLAADQRNSLSELLYKTTGEIVYMVDEIEKHQINFNLN